jgi:type VI protein secretion system component VasK
MLRPIFNAMNGNGNPMEMLGQMASQDERLQQVMNAIRQNGGIQQAVYAEAKRRNQDPADALNQARQVLYSFKMK